MRGGSSGHGYSNIGRSFPEIALYIHEKDSLERLFCFSYTLSAPLGRPSPWKVCPLRASPPSRTAMPVSIAATLVHRHPHPHLRAWCPLCFARKVWFLSAFGDV